MLLFTCFSLIVLGQENIYSKEGKPLLNRFQYIASCLRSLHKDRNDQAALAICECKANSLNRRVSNKRYRKFTKNGVIDLIQIIKEDTTLEKQLNECFYNSGQMILIQAEGFQNEFISSCIKNIQKNTAKTLDSNKVMKFCSCQLELIKSKKSDSAIKTMLDLNSLFFYEMVYKCGDPYSSIKDMERNWRNQFTHDIDGPQADTLKVLNLNGMTYLKVRVGSKTQVWLFDTGASDLLINIETEELLKNENILNSSSYLGTGEYEMANGVVDTCRKYNVSNIQIGRYMVNNVIVAVSNKGKRIIMGRALLNKFKKWSINNEENTLILVK